MTDENRTRDIFVILLIDNTDISTHYEAPMSIIADNFMTSSGIYYEAKATHIDNFR